MLRTDAAEVSTSTLKSEREDTRPCAMPESTQGMEKITCATWDRVPQRMFARNCHTRPDMPTSYKRTRVASTQKKKKCAPALS